MLDDRSGATTEPRPGLLGWTARLLVAAGIAALVWCALVVVDAYVYQRASRLALDDMPLAANGAPPPLEAPTLVRRATGTAMPGAPLAALSIPRINLSAVVLHGTDALTLRRGLGHIEHTAWPGEAGNVAIAGHRDSFFRSLRDVELGDDVILDTPGARLRYRVASFRVVASNEVSVLEPTDEATLTLVTCYPFWFLGQAPDRFVVRATRVLDREAEGRVESRTSGLEVLPVDGAVTLIAALAVAPVPRRAPAARTGDALSGDPQTTRTAAPVRDDATLVQEAVERFRLIYNARLARRGEMELDGPLAFQPCTVTVDGDRATATCDPASVPESLEPGTWVFDVGKAADGWTISSIARR
jgi:sortase A